MPEIIQDWLGTKLGVLIDMSPEKFGRNTKDGTLLAKLLYKYGVIPAHILNNVKESRNYFECYNNLVVLKPWLRYIGVIHEDSTLQKMAGGEGSAAISLFYSVYLNLERNDRLHYLSVQKERRPSLDKDGQESCAKFKVSWVPERLVSEGSGDYQSKLEAPLFENPDMIEWHKTKCKQIVDQIKKTKAKFRKVIKEKEQLAPLISKHASSRPLDKRQLEAEETRKNISEFEKNHPDRTPNLNFAELTELQSMNEMQPCFAPSLTEARNIVNTIKRRRKGDVYAKNFQQKMQHILLDEQWKELIQRQERDFENKVCASLMKQSQYEKQMAKKLYLIRNQKRVLAENRKKIECLKIDECQKEYEETIQEIAETKGEYWEGEEIEKERIKELHRRLYDEKARNRRTMLTIECRKICEAWADVAIRISEYRELIGCQIPKSLMKDLKELFFKDLSIFDILDHFEDLYLKDPLKGDCFGECSEEEEGEVDNYLSQECKLLKNAELDRQSILDECDFNDYIHLMGPWMVALLFPNSSETEVKQLVLGYVVHKLLAVKYPSPNAPVPVDIKPMAPTAVVQGLNEEAATNMLLDLMESCKILVVKVEDAINFVLSAYKDELSVVRDIDITFQHITEETLQQKNSNSKEKEVSRKLQLLKPEVSEKSVSEEELFLVDKEVQTPRRIPEDDPLLSPNAELGKQAFESLGAGDPVPDSVIAPAVVAYVLSKQDAYDGWLILNYPLMYLQASELEYYLTGYRNLPLMEDTETLEEAEDFSYRGPFGKSMSRDVFWECRLSKLVPKPDENVPSEGGLPKSYFDSVIKVKKAFGTPRRRSQDSEEMGPMEEFYLNLGTFRSFEYQNLNFQTIKNLGRVILRISDVEAGAEFVRKSSLEVFGDAILELNEKWEPRRKTTKEMLAGIKKTDEAKAPPDYGVKDGKNSYEEDEEFNEEKTTEAASVGHPPQPGDPTWDWAAGQQSEDFLFALASIWENMEAVYIEDFKNLFFSLRVHRCNVTNYCGFVRKSLRILMRRPDEKQKVLNEFQQMFNDIDEDLRPDVDVKCELHVRVSELEQALMTIADERKKNSLRDVSSVAQDGWVSDEMANLVNAFLTALQLEADRSVDSCQVIMDYYISLQQKTPEAKPIGKVLVPKLQAQNRKYSVSSATSNKIGSPRNSDLKRGLKSFSDHATKLSTDKPSKTRSFGDKKKRSCDSGLSGAAEFMTDILINLALPEDGLTPFHNFFMESVRTVTNEVRTTLETCLLDAKKAEKTVPSTTRQTKNSKKPSETNIVPSSENLTLEWITALEDEISRFAFRSQLILARGIFDMNEFLTTILNILSSVSEEITEMYLKEIRSISECCKVFRCGIEEEIAIQPVLELKEDEFFVHMDENIPKDEESRGEEFEEEQRRFSFTVEQLERLFGKLQRIAPEGEIVKKSLVYIFEDLRMLNPEVDGGRCFPEVWSDIEPDDVTIIMNEVYQNLEVVHWKDFIVYALEVPIPTVVDILSMRRLFRKFDPLVTELISRDHYDCVTLWFEDSLNESDADKARKAKDLLFRMYQVNEFQANYSALLLAFCKDEDPEVGFEKALSLALGKKIRKGEDSIKDFVLGESPSYEYFSYDDVQRESYRKPPCCPTISTEGTVKCIPKEKIARCECKDSSTVDESTVEPEQNYEESEEEGEGLYLYDTKMFDKSEETSLIPFSIVASLLKASFPSLPQLSILLDCQQSLQETLNAIYDSLDSYDNTLEVHKLLNHNFIQRLLRSTNKFKLVNLKRVLLSVAKDNPPMPRAMCITKKPNLSYCLRN